ncbi:hypothetical protein KAJ89_04760, partial [Candidatus Parcubacteria bacterium]|nr:hypothetical protein [Candidatus Parcubacteria bacterium]
MLIKSNILIKLLQRIFGITPATSSSKKVLALSWRFIIVFYLFIHIILGQSPIKAITKYLGAEDNEIVVIRLYAGASRISYDDETNLGWKNNEAVIGSPDLPGSADISDFSDSNSSLYIGGSEKLVLGDFWFLEDPEIYIPEEEYTEIEIIENGEDYQEESGKSEDLVVESIVEVEASTTVEDVVASSTETITTSTNLLHLTPSPSPSEGEDGREEEIENVEIIVEEDSQQVEIFEPDWGSESDIEIEISTSSEEELYDDEILSLFRNLTITREAKAQEFIIDEITGLSELGELKEVKLGMSFALDQVYQRGEFVPFDNLTPSPSPSEGEGNSNVSSLEEIIEIEEEASTSEAASSTVEVFEIESVSSSSGEFIDEPEISSSTDSVGTSTARNLFEKIFKAQTAQAQNQLLEDAKIAIWYSLGEKREASTSEEFIDEQIWQLLDVLTQEELSNHLNGGYFEFEADFISYWEQIESLEIKFEGLREFDQGIVAYVDSFWVEAMYDPETELEKIKKRERWENALELLSSKLAFQIDEGGELSFKYNKSEERIWDTLFEMVGLSNFWQDV